MTQQPFNAAALRGAVDLSGLKTGGPSGGSRGAARSAAGSGQGSGQRSGQGPGASSAAAAGDGVPGRSGLVVEGTDTNFTEVVNASLTVPSVVVLWSGTLPESADFVDLVVTVAAALEGRIQVVSVDVDANPGLLRAFQIQSVPMTLGLVQGQPVPLFAGPQPQPEVRAYLDELVKLAVQHGVAGRVDLGEDGEGGDTGQDIDESALPPLHEAAYEAIERGDLDGAAAAYRQALHDDPRDTEAELGLAQVGLLQRTAGVDPAAARQAAAADPSAIDAALVVADLDLLGGHVEDAFARLIELVRTTSGEDRDRVRAHLVELFNVVGNQDERVRKGRTTLMSALF